MPAPRSGAGASTCPLAGDASQWPSCSQAARTGNGLITSVETKARPAIRECLIWWNLLLKPKDKLESFISFRRAGTASLSYVVGKKWQWDQGPFCCFQSTVSANRKVSGTDACTHCGTASTAGKGGARSLGITRPQGIAGMLSSGPAPPSKAFHMNRNRQGYVVYHPRI